MILPAIHPAAAPRAEVMTPEPAFPQMEAMKPKILSAVLVSLPPNYPCPWPYARSGRR